MKCLHGIINSKEIVAQIAPLSTHKSKDIITGWIVNMENNQNEKNLQQEKLKLHFTYIVVICFIICIGTVILAAHNQETFVSQISFAGTITSIVLSILAIWLSMSGERTTNDIRIKISESTERLSETTKMLKI